jgi:hypothetical protein
MQARNIPAGVIPEHIIVEQHYRPSVLAALWGFSEDTIVEWFRDEPGVLKAGTTGRGTRSRRELSIPCSVAKRVYGERTK